MPKPHQIRALEFLVSRPGAGLFAKPGLGKTTTALAAIDAYLAAGRIDFAVVVAPLLICYNTWPGEISKWSNFNHLRHVILHGPKKSERLGEPADVYLINHEGLEWLHDNWPRAWDDKKIALIADESTRFKAHNTIRFRVMRGGVINRRRGDRIEKKRLRRLLNRFAFRYILTGTPMPKGYHDLWSQIYLIDDGESLGGYISHYRNAYFEKDFDGFTYLLKHGADEAIRDAISDRVLFLDDEEHLDLPSLVGDIVGVSRRADDADRSIGSVVVDLPENARRAYDEMEDLFVTELEADRVTAANAAVASGKLRQIANGGVYVDGRRWETIHTAKAEATLSIVEELGGDPALITYEFAHDLERLRRVLGKGVPYLGKGISPTESNRVIERWNAGDIPALLVQPTSAGFGLNLQYGGRAIIWHSLIWNYEFYYQLIKRLWRQGQEGRVFLYHVLARGTIDYAVLGALRGRSGDETTFLQALRKYYAK